MFVSRQIFFVSAMIIKMVKTWNVVIIGGRVTLCKKDTSLRIWVQNQSIFPLYFCDPVYFLYSQFDFLYSQLFTFYMVNSSFYVVNFLLLIRSIFTSYMVNFLLFISVNVRCRLRTKVKVHTGGKMQTKDCRPGVKCSF